jgi:tetratricopeptide (TPR) repeat protein
MDEIHRKEIFDHLNLRETQDLLEIWEENKRDEWEGESFEIIQAILLERLGYVPPHSIQSQVKEILKRADSFWKAGELEKAIADCTLAVQMAPGLAIVYDHRGQIYEDMGMLEEAIVDFQEAVRLDRGLKDTWDSLKRAERDIQEQFKESSTGQHLDQALEYADNEEPERTQEEIELARQSLPGIAVAHNHLGLVYDELGQFELAIQAYLEAIQLNPRLYAARQNLRDARVRLEAEQYHLAALENYEGTPEKESGFTDGTETIVDFTENQDASLSEIDNDAPGWLYMDEPGFLMAGWPGHRTRPGRCGYDPLDTDFELAHMEGVMIRLLFTRKLRSHNPFYLFGMAYLGIIFCLPLLLAGMALMSQNDLIPVLVLIIYSPFWVIGAAMLLNVYLSLQMKKPEECDKGNSTFF